MHELIEELRKRNDANGGDCPTHSQSNTVRKMCMLPVQESSENHAALGECRSQNKENTTASTVATTNTKYTSHRDNTSDCISVRVAITNTNTNKRQAAISALASVTLAEIITARITLAEL